MLALVKSIILTVVCGSAFLLGWVMAMGGDPGPGHPQPEALMALLAASGIFGAPLVWILGFRYIWNEASKE